MGAFNTVTVQGACPFCGHPAEWTVQFKYGNCWQFAYRIGDRLRWGGNKKGRNVGGRVRTDGIVEGRCARCSHDDIQAAVYFVDNVINTVELRREALKIDGYYESLDGPASK
jgi:hypothetical protein